MKRIQRKRTRGYRLPPGAVYVSRPSLFGNPWSLRDARDRDIPEPERAAWCVERYRQELDHAGLLSDRSEHVSHDRWKALWALFDELPQELDARGHRSIRPLFRHLLRDATALACWCRLCPAHADGLPAGVNCPDCAPCHADVLVELWAAERAA